MPDAALFATFIHLLGVVGVAGSSTTFILVLSLMRRARDTRDVRLWSGLGTFAESAFPFATLVLLISGGYLVQKESYSWRDGWISFSAIALVLMAVAALKINTLKMNAIHHAAEEAPDGAVPPVLAAQAADPVLFAVTHAITTAQLGIIWNMTTKPGDLQAGVAIVLAALIGAASAAPMVARQRRLIAGES